jgi:hypothetical protein
VTPRHDQTHHQTHDQTGNRFSDRTGAWAWAPDTGTMLVSTIIGLLAFVGALLYGPTPPTPPRPAATIDQVRPWIRGNAINAISQGRDEKAINELLEHLKTDPGFGWGWRLVYQLASRDESLTEERDLAADRLVKLTRGEAYDEEWPWDRRTRGVIHMIQGQTAEARSTLARGIVRVQEHSIIDHGLASFLEACMLAIGDQPDEALAALEQAIEEGSYLNSGWLLTTPDLDSLRDDPRLEALIARSAELERGPPPQPTTTPTPTPAPPPEPDDTPGEAPGDPSGG